MVERLRLRAGRRVTGTRTRLPSLSARTPADSMARSDPSRPHAVASPTSPSLRHVLSLEDLEPAARRHLPRPIFGFVAGAAESNWSLRDNREVFSEYGFRPRMLVGVAGRSTGTTLFGRDYAAPFGIAPMGLSALITYRGDLVLARAAAAANLPMIMSASSLIPMEEVVRAAPGTWFQAYLPGEPDRIAALVDRVAAAGVETLVHTVDVIVAANRENKCSCSATPKLPTLLPRNRTSRCCPFGNAARP